MLYYYNRDGKFQKESSKEYKTEKGAVEKLQKEGEGAVFDETGQMVLSLADKGEVPEGALDTNEDGSVPAYNEGNEQVGMAEAETVAEATGESVSDAEASEGAADSQEQPDEEHLEPEEPERAEQPDRTFDVQTTCDSLRIRAGAGKAYRIVGYIREKAGNKENHAIVKEKDGWGKLASGEGWIELAFAKKVS